MAWKQAHPKPQLLFVEGFSISDGHPGGSGLSVRLTPALCNWLAGQTSQSLEPVSRTMFDFWQGGELYRCYDFRIHYEPPKGGLHLNVPGQGCGLDPDRRIGEES